MLIKKKSLVVSLISGCVISAVLALTLVGYAVYLELKNDELSNAYDLMLANVQAKFYAKYIEVARLGAAIETSGALKGKPVIEGIVRNHGYKDVSDMVLRVTFLDRGGAILYDVAFHPQEPALGSASLSQVAIPYLAVPSSGAIRPEGSRTFKRILTDCPPEILAELTGSGSSATSRKWSGRLDYEVLAVTF